MIIIKIILYALTLGVTAKVILGQIKKNDNPTITGCLITLYLIAAAAITTIIDKL